MAEFEIREEVLNVLLADLLQKRGLLSMPESIRRSITGRTRRLPDVTVADLLGVRIVIEGRVGSSPAIRNSLFRDSRARVEEGISPICLAVLYPETLRHTDSIPMLRRKLARTPLMVRVISEGSEGDWNETSIDGITDILRRSYELLVSEDVVASAVDDLGGAIEEASQLIAANPATPERLRELLGIPEDTETKGTDGDEED